MSNPESSENGWSPSFLNEVEDPLWRMAAYRVATEVLDHATDDTALLLEHGKAKVLADQLYRSAGSIAANIAEGYSRSSGADRVRMMEYALGSARECRVWYRAARRLLPEESVKAQHFRLSRICKLLLVMIPDERKRLIRRVRSPDSPELTQAAARSTQDGTEAAATLHPEHAP
jgi:four helix bundle protein